MKNLQHKMDHDLSTQEVEVSTPFQPRVIRQYTEQERTNALAVYDNIGNLEIASESLGIPLSTLGTWITDPRYNSKLRQKTAQSLADKFENAANTFVDLAVKKAKKANLSHLMTGAGIAVDKMQLLRGQPTSISESIERQELTVLLESALGKVIDVTPEQGTQ